MALAGLASFKRRLGRDTGDTSEDVLLSGILDGVTAMIEQHCQRALEYVDADATEYYHGGAGTILLRRWPVTTIASVKEDSEYDWAAATALVADEDYRLQAERGRLIRLPFGSTWLEGPDVVQVIYRGGYLGPDATPVSGVSVAPEHIQEAVLQQGAELFKRRKDLGAYSTGLTGINAGSMVFYSGFDLLPGVKGLLEGERRLW